ncbi:hypothetical protein AGLY_001266, partial [Aphis glycines]
MGLRVGSPQIGFDFFVVDEFSSANIVTCSLGVDRVSPFVGIRSLESYLLPDGLLPLFGFGFRFGEFEKPSVVVSSECGTVTDGVPGVVELFFGIAIEVVSRRKSSYCSDPDGPDVTSVELKDNTFSVASVSLWQKYLTLDSINVFISTVKYILVCKHLKCDVVDMLFNHESKKRFLLLI